MFEILIYIYLESILCANCLMHDFFIGNASEFLPGPIYDLNQAGQVVAGTYNVIYFFFIYLYSNLFVWKKFESIRLKEMMYRINSDIIFLSQFNSSNIERWLRQLMDVLLIRSDMTWSSLSLRNCCRYLTYIFFYFMIL